MARFITDRKAADLHKKRLGVLRPMVQLAQEVLAVVGTADPSEADAAIALSFRQCTEFADAVELLSSHGVSAPAASMARSCLETGAQTVFLARDPHPIRVAAYHLAPLMAELPALRKRQNESSLDPDDLRELRDLSRGVAQLLAERCGTAAERSAYEQLLKHGSRPTWYSVQGGPDNIHRMLSQLGLGVLSVFYTDLNSTVHGSPKHAFTAMEAAGTWLPPLRSPSGFAYQPILIAVTALQIATSETVLHFASRLPRCAQLFVRFVPHHRRRSAQAGFKLFESPLDEAGGTASS